jgi:tetratricopeptide (TPR) repeat protein
VVVSNNGGGCWGGWGGWGWGCGSWGWGWGWGWCGPSVSFSFGFGYPYYASCYYPYYYPRYRYPYYGYGYPYYDYGSYCAYPSYPYYDSYPYVYREVEVPDYVAAPTVVEPAEESAAESISPVPAPLEGEETLEAGLRPAQLSFVSGLHAMEEGDYDRATEAFFNASVEDPDSRLVKVFLATSLFSVGEYPYAAEYLRTGLENWEEFPSYEWDVRSLYGNERDFETQLSLLEKHTALDPSDVDAQLVLGFIAMNSGNGEKAGAAFDAVRTFSADPVELSVASRYLSELEDRSGAFPRSDDERFDLAVRGNPAVQAFLASPSSEDVPTLPIR